MFNMKAFSKRTAYLLLFLILLMSLLLRVYRLSERVIFDADQEFAATFAYEVLKIFPIRLIGQGLSVQSLFMGPLYFYFLVPFFALSNLHPIGGYFGSITLGLVTIVAYFLIIKSIFGTSAGLIAAFFRAILFSAVKTDLLMTPAFSSELAVLFTWFCLYKYWQKNDTYLLPIGFLFGLYTSFHPILFPFYFAFLALAILQKHIPRKKCIVLSLVCFLLPLAPLLLFEYFHKFLEVKALFSLKNSGNSEVKTLSTLLDYIKIIFTYPTTLLNIRTPDLLIIVLSSLFYIFSSIPIMKRIGFWKNSFHRTIVIATILIFLLYYFIIPVHVSEYYFIGVFTIIFIYTIGNISILLKERKLLLLSAVLVIVTIVNFIDLYKSWNSSFRDSLKDKETVITTIARLQPDNNMKFYYDTDFGQHFGLGYLARYYHVEGKGGRGVPEYIIVIPASRRAHEITFSSGSVGLVVKR